MTPRRTAPLFAAAVLMVLGAAVGAQDARPADGARPADASRPADGTKPESQPPPRKDSMGLRFTKDYFPGTRDAQGRWMGGTETLSLIAHQGKLFAGLGYWMDVPYGKPKGDEPWTGAQVLVKEAREGSWHVDASFGPGCVRVEALFSATFTTDARGRPLQPPVSILIAGPGDWNPTGPRWATAWTRDDTTGQWTKTEIVQEPFLAGVRSFATHVDGVTGIHHLFAGVAHGAVCRGAYDAQAPGRLRWDPAPELSGTGRPMCMAETGGALYAACGIKDESPRSGGLFRRIDGPAPRWELVYRWPHLLREKGDETVILRGLTPAPDPVGGGREVLLATRTYPGVVERIDPAKDHAATVELDIKAYFARAWGIAAYRGPCLSAYNRIVPAAHPATGERVYLIGVWVEHPERARPPNNGAYYLVRRRDGTYEWGNVYDFDHPVPAGSGLCGTRAIEVSPFPEDGGRVFYFGGYDCAGRDSHNTAWIYKAAPAAGGR